MSSGLPSIFEQTSKDSLIPCRYLLFLSRLSIASFFFLSRRDYFLLRFRLLPSFLPTHTPSIFFVHHDDANAAASTSRAAAATNAAVARPRSVRLTLSELPLGKKKVMSLARSFVDSLSSRAHIEG